MGRYKKILVDRDPYISMLSSFTYLTPVRIEKMGISLSLKRWVIFKRTPGFVSQERKRLREKLEKDGELK